ncbi:hypothetical protein WJX72_011873 [[Myrmecia] bisecta]|uniref:Uncharacterized protein n=1 Tax=[Myrmecia] bisecta TaxID=41462 RepID=A0AAW1PVC9_9CHLO
MSLPITLQPGNTNATELEGSFSLPQGALGDMQLEVLLGGQQIAGSPASFSVIGELSPQPPQEPSGTWTVTSGAYNGSVFVGLAGQPMVLLVTPEAPLQPLPALDVSLYNTDNAASQQLQCTPVPELPDHCTVEISTTTAGGYKLAILQHGQHIACAAANSACSGPFAVVIAPLQPVASLSYMAAPAGSTVEAGTSLSLAVYARDEFGNAAAAAAVSVQLQCGASDPIFAVITQAILQDAYGNPITDPAVAAASPLSLEVQGAGQDQLFALSLDPSAWDLRIAAAPDPDGLYDLTAEPTVAGTYSLALVLGGTAVGPQLSAPSMQDAFGNAYTSLDIAASANITLASGSGNSFTSSSLQPTITLRTDGTLLVQYASTQVGDVALTVALNSQPISGSPFQGTITPAAASAARSAISGPDTSSCIAGMQCLLYIAAADAFGNLRTDGTDVFVVSGDVPGLSNTVQRLKDGSGLYQDVGTQSGGLFSPLAIAIAPAAAVIRAANCQAAGPGLSGSMAGVPGVIIITARDSQGVRQSAGDANFLLEITTTGGQVLPASAIAYSQTFAAADGTYSLTYTIQQAGSYVASAYLNSKSPANLLGTASSPDPGSLPFPASIAILPGPTSPATSAFTVGADRWVAGAAVAAVIAPRDAFGNPQRHSGGLAPDVFTVTAALGSQQVPFAAAWDAAAGIFNVTGKLLAAGTYTLLAMLGSAQLPAISISVLPAALSLNTTSASGQALATATAGTTTNFTILPQDAYGNPIPAANIACSLTVVKADQTASVLQTACQPDPLDAFGNSGLVSGAAPSIAVSPVASPISDSLELSLQQLQDSAGDPLMQYIVIASSPTAGNYGIAMSINGQPVGEPVQTIISPGEIDLQQSTIAIVNQQTGPGSTAGEPLVVEIMAADTFGNPLNMTAYLELRQGSAASYRTITDFAAIAGLGLAANGTQRVTGDAIIGQRTDLTFTPVLGGSLTISANLTIGSSSYAYQTVVLVSAAAVDLARTQVAGPGWVTAAAGQVAEFQVTAMDAYGNVKAGECQSFSVSADFVAALPLNITSSPDNTTCIVAYAAAMPGQHSLQVMYQGAMAASSALTVVHVTIAVNGTTISDAAPVTCLPAAIDWTASAVTVTPVAVVAAANATITVVPQDLYGNLQTPAANAAITLAARIGRASIPLALVNGAFTGNVSLAAVGTYSFSLLLGGTSGAGKVQLPGSYSLTVVEGPPYVPATQMRGEGATRAQAGITTSLYLSLFDIGGNPVLNATAYLATQLSAALHPIPQPANDTRQDVPVSLTYTPEQHTLLGRYTPKFPGLYSLQLSVGGAAAAVAGGYGAIAVGPGPVAAGNCVAVGVSGTVLAGNLTTSISVQDALGNAVSSDPQAAFTITFVGSANVVADSLSGMLQILVFPDAYAAPVITSPVVVPFTLGSFSSAAGVIVQFQPSVTGSLKILCTINGQLILDELTAAASFVNGTRNSLLFRVKDANGNVLPAPSGASLASLKVASSVGAIDPSKTTVQELASGLGFGAGVPSAAGQVLSGRAGSTLTFLIRTFDTNGVALPTGSSSSAANFAVAVAPSDTNSRTALASNQDGTYTLTFSATIAISHYLTLAYSGQVISTLAVQITPAASDAAQSGLVKPDGTAVDALASSASGAGLQVATAGLQSSFSVIPKDAFGNLVLTLPQIDFAGGIAVASSSISADSIAVQYTPQTATPLILYLQYPGPGGKPQLVGNQTYNIAITPADPPQLVSAQLQPSLVAVVVDFDQATNQAGMGAAVSSCTPLLADLTIAKLGTSPTCQFTSPSTLLINLGSDATLSTQGTVLPDSLELRPNAIGTAGSNSAAVAVTIAYMPIGVSILGGNRVVSQANGLTLQAVGRDPDNTVDANGTPYPFLYTWTLVMPSGRAQPAAVAGRLFGASAVQRGLLVLGPGELSAGIHTFIVSAIKEPLTALRAPTTAAVTITAVDWPTAGTLAVQLAAGSSTLAAEGYDGVEAIDEFYLLSTGWAGMSTSQLEYEFRYITEPPQSLPSVPAGPPPTTNQPGGASSGGTALADAPSMLVAQGLLTGPNTAVVTSVDGIHPPDATDRLSAIVGIFTSVPSSGMLTFDLPVELHDNAALELRRWDGTFSSAPKRRRLLGAGPDGSVQRSGNTVTVEVASLNGYFFIGGNSGFKPRDAAKGGGLGTGPARAAALGLIITAAVLGGAVLMALTWLAVGRYRQRQSELIFPRPPGTTATPSAAAYAVLRQTHLDGVTTTAGLLAGAGRFASETTSHQLTNPLFKGVEVGTRRAASASPMAHYTPEKPKATAPARSSPVKPSPLSMTAAPGSFSEAFNRRLEEASNAEEEEDLVSVPAHFGTPPRHPASRHARAKSAAPTAGRSFTASSPTGPSQNTHAGPKGLLGQTNSAAAPASPAGRLSPSKHIRSASASPLARPPTFDDNH